MWAMPISHVCQGCGEDLAALRPGPDPHYGLPVIVCPNCRLASVRTREPLITGWRYGRRLLGAVLLTAGHTAFFGGAVALGFSALLRLLFSLGPNQGDDLRGSALIAGAAAFFGGVWMGVSMPHRGIAARAGMWAAGLLLCTGLLFAVCTLTAPWREVNPADLLEQPAVYGRLVLAALASAALVVAAEAVAAPARFVLRFGVSSLFRFRRTRARLRRSGQ